MSAAANRVRAILAAEPEIATPELAARLCVSYQVAARLRRELAPDGKDGGAAAGAPVGKDGGEAAGDHDPDVLAPPISGGRAARPSIPSPPASAPAPAPGGANVTPAAGARSGHLPDRARKSGKGGAAASDLPPPPRAAQKVPWIDDQAAALRALAAEGLTRAAIAARLGRTASQVGWALHRLGVSTRRPARSAATMARPEAEAGLGNIRPARRRCLRCGAAFASQGPHNRLCGPCRGAAAEAYILEDAHVHC